MSKPDFVYVARVVGSARQSRRGQAAEYRSFGRLCQRRPPTLRAVAEALTAELRRFDIFHHIAGQFLFRILLAVYQRLPPIPMGW